MTAALVDGRDSDRLRALNDKYAHGLWCYVVRLNGGDRVKAQDVVQETLLRAWRNGAVFEQADGSQPGWLFTVARHIVIDERRSSRSHSEVVTDQISEQLVETRRNKPWTANSYQRPYARCRASTGRYCWNASSAARRGGRTARLPEGACEFCLRHDKMSMP